jgi:hypothetical protein
MPHTEELRRQHDGVTELMAGITAQIKSYRGRDDAYRLTLGVAQLLGLLRIHLAQGDQLLYSKLINSGDPHAAALARSFTAEMGDIAARLEEFSDRWSSSAGISARFSDFRAEAINLFAAIRLRIRCENRYLYPIADRLPPPQLRRVA